MFWKTHPVAKMFNGTRREKISSVLTLATWFCVGAFAASTIEHHMDLAALTDQTAALIGGTTASVLAVVAKAV
jgi:hypothetical protein